MHAHIRIKSLYSFSVILQSMRNDNCMQFYYIDEIVVRFNKSVYTINETDGTAKIKLVLSKPSSTNIDLKVMIQDISATSELCL